jgi:hypothetical protein
VKIVGYIFDLDGTIYRGNRVTPGACQSVQILRKRGREIVFLSNKPLFSRKAYAEKLCALGIPAQEDEVITSSWVLARELAKEAPEAKVFAIGETPLLDELTRAGLTFTEDPKEIDYVIAAFDRTFDYRKLNIAFQALKRGAHFYATNPDRTCPVEGGEIPDAAAVIAALPNFRRWMRKSEVKNERRNSCACRGIASVRGRSFRAFGRAKRGCSNLCGCALGCGFAGNLFPWNKPPHPLCQPHSQWHSFPNNGAFCGP